MKKVIQHNHSFTCAASTLSVVQYNSCEEYLVSHPFSFHKKHHKVQVRNWILKTQILLFSNTKVWTSTPYK